MHVGTHTMEQIVGEWKPAIFGFLTLIFNWTNEFIKIMNDVSTILVALATFVYIVVKIYYKIKNKGKEK